MFLAICGAPVLSALAQASPFENADLSPALIFNSQSAGSAPYHETSRMKVIAASMAIPGWGQKMTGHSGRAEAFLGAEIGIWTAFTVFQVQGHLRRNSYIDYAEVMAGVQNGDNASEEYYRNVGRYMSTEDYMQDVQRDARARYLDDLEARRAYVENHSIPTDRRWEWENQSDRHRYRDKRSASMSAYQRRTYMIGVGIVNRLLSAIDAARSFQAPGSNRGLTFHLQPDPDNRGPLQFCVSIPIP